MHTPKTNTGIPVCRRLRSDDIARWQCDVCREESTNQKRAFLKEVVLNSGLLHKRVQTPNGVWVLWKCGRIEDRSRVKDLGVGGLFIETKKVCPINATVELHFLVQDGEIRASATVRFTTSDSGMDLQFKTVRGEDRERFAAMLKRLIRRSLPSSRFKKWPRSKYGRIGPRRFATLPRAPRQPGAELPRAQIGVSPE